MIPTKTKAGIASVLIVVACMLPSCKPRENCCKQYDPGSDQSTYCNKHRTAAYDFVLVTEDSLSRERFDLLKELVGRINNCSTVECIEQAVNQDPALARLQETYRVEHQMAESGTNLPIDQKDDLILCGFHNAIEDVDANLKQEGR